MIRRMDGQLRRSEKGMRSLESACEVEPMSSCKFIVTRWLIPGLALLVGLGVLNAALLMAGDPISQGGPAHDRGTGNVLTTGGAAAG